MLSYYPNNFLFTCFPVQLLTETVRMWSVLVLKTLISWLRNCSWIFMNLQSNKWEYTFRQWYSMLFAHIQLNLLKYLLLYRVRNCDQLVANATENLALATRISRPVASRRLTFSIVSLFWTTAQGIKSKNFTFDFNKKLTSRLVEVFNPHIK